jgi:hypothetical protein
MHCRTLYLILLASVAPILCAGGRQMAAPDHGIIHFYEPKMARQSAPDRHDPDVVGAEAIFWWGNLEREEGVYDWSRVDQELAKWQAAGKRLDIRLATAHNSPFIAPQWLFDRYHVRRVGRGDWSDFEMNMGDYVLGPEAQRTEQPALGFWAEGVTMVSSRIFSTVSFTTFCT